jgi:ABC-type nitrate/sulfonate/bicarbonate transport system permease component
MALSRIWRGALFPVVALLLMEVTYHSGPQTSDSFAAPSQIFVAFLEAIRDGTLAGATYETVVACAVGVSLGMALGLVVGVLMGLSPWLAASLNLTVELVRPIPSIAIIPVGMLVFGLGFQLEIAIVAFACTWPMLILSRAAIAGVEQRLLEVGRALQLPLPTKVRKLILPAIMPNIFVAVRLSLTLALIVAITVEITANPIGLGYQLMLAQQSIRPDLMYAFLLWIATLGWIVNFILVRTETRLFRNRGEDVVG